MGGKFKNPTYFDVCSGMTGHAEVVQVHYDSSIISFKDLCLFSFQFMIQLHLIGKAPMLVLNIDLQFY